MLRKITESRPRKSAVRPVYSSPPESGQEWNLDQRNVKCAGNSGIFRVIDLQQQYEMVLQQSGPKD